MKLSIAAIGHGRQAPEHLLAQTWFNKLPHQGQWIERVSKRPTGADRKRDESEKLLAALPHGAFLVALDPYGKDISSEDLATMIQTQRDQGRRDAVFAIGGADGHDEVLLNAADLRVSFGRQTWPHMLFRAMVAEQLYRAEMILIGHPYHHA